MERNIKVNLDRLSNSEVISRLENLVLHEKETTTEIIRHLAEVDRRRLYASEGFSSLFEYVTKKLGYSKTSAMRRISVARAAKNLPERRFDFWGSLAITIVLSCFSLGMTEGQRQGFTHSLPLGLLFAAAIGLVGFIVLESRVSQPMLDLSLFRSQIFSLSLLTGWLVFMALGVRPLK